MFGQTWQAGFQEGQLSPRDLSNWQFFARGRRVEEASLALNFSPEKQQPGKSTLFLREFLPALDGAGSSLTDFGRQNVPRRARSSLLQLVTYTAPADLEKFFFVLYSGVWGFPFTPLHHVSLKDLLVGSFIVWKTTNWEAILSPVRSGFPKRNSQSLDPGPDFNSGAGCLLVRPFPHPFTAYSS